MNRSLAFAVLLLFARPAPSSAYIDAGGWQITLPEILSEFRTIVLVEVDKVNLARGGFRFRIGKPLKGAPEFKDLRLQMEWGDAGPPFREMKPGRVAVHFTQSCDRKVVPTESSPAFENLIAQRACLTFIDGAWFLTTPGADGWQSGTVRRDFELVFTGSTAGLADAVTNLLRGHEVAVRCRRQRNTAETHGVRYSLKAPNSKRLARDPAEPGASSRPVSAWAVELRDPSGLVRTRAALALSELGPRAREAEPALAAALRDPDPEVRAASVAALGAIEPERRASIEALARALTDEDWFVRFGAAQALGSLGPRSAAAAPALVQALRPADLLKDFRPVRCGAAMVALARIDPGAPELEGAVRLVVGKLLEDERQGSFGARATGARLLGDCGPVAHAAAPALARLLRDPDGDVQVAAAEAILKIAPEASNPEALGALAQALRHPDLLVRSRAAEALGGLGSRATEALPALGDRAQDPEPEVRLAAAEAARKIQGGRRE